MAVRAQDLQQKTLQTLRVFVSVRVSVSGLVFVVPVTVTIDRVVPVVLAVIVVPERRESRCYLRG